MGKSQLLNLVNKWVGLRKFVFHYPLQTGVQVYGFVSFISSILIADVLLSKVIDQQMCAAHHKTDLLSSIQSQVQIQLQCLSTKHNILPQACQAFISALLLCFVKRASVTLCWVGCKFVVSLMEFTFLYEWCRQFFIQFFSFHFPFALFAVIFISVYAYGVLVAVSYYAELTGNQASYNLDSKEMETNVDIPISPDLPNF